MVFWTLLIVLAVLLFLVYFKGVKAGASWGMPVAVLLALALVGVAIATMAGTRRGRRGGGGGFAGIVQAGDRSSANAIAAELKDELGASPRLFLMGQVPRQSRTGWGPAWRFWSDGLNEGFGGQTWQVVGYFGTVSGASAEDVNAVLAAVEDQIDAVISFDGLPADPEALSIYAGSKPPVVGVYFRDGATPEQLRSLLTRGLVQVAVVTEKEELKVFTPERLP